MRTMAAITAVLLLAGCGAAKELTPAPGQQLPPAPYGARTKPTPTDLLSVPTQARPGRSDELLYQSQDRRDDQFDLPPD